MYLQVRTYVPTQSVVHHYCSQASPTLPLSFSEYTGSGDVKYHLGTSYNRPTVNGKMVHLSLMANPSHLEVCVCQGGGLCIEGVRRGGAVGAFLMRAPGCVCRTHGLQKSCTSIVCVWGGGGVVKVGVHEKSKQVAQTGQQQRARL